MPDKGPANRAGNPPAGLDPLGHAIPVELVATRRQHAAGLALLLHLPHAHRAIQRLLILAMSPLPPWERGVVDDPERHRRRLVLGAVVEEADVDDDARQQHRRYHAVEHQVPVHLHCF